VIARRNAVSVHPAPSGQAGFSLIELLVSILASSILLLAVFATLNFNSRMARVQGHVADLQQSLRIAQYDVTRMVRMAGRGGLLTSDPATGPLPNGIALGVRDNVEEGETLVDGEAETAILAGTDVLTVRGVFSSPLYQVNPADTTVLDLDLPNRTGTITITSPNYMRLVQDLQPLKDAISNKIPDALLLVSNLDDTIYAVVQVLPDASGFDANSVTIAFQISGPDLANAYGRLSTGGAFPAAMDSVRYVGLLEEYRFYVREERAANDFGDNLASKLARARFFPGTDIPYGNNNEEARIDVADNIVDLQVALGLDSANRGFRRQDENHFGEDDQIVETADGADDDWLFNGERDQAADPVWQAVNPVPALQYVRVTTLARTDRRDPSPQFVAEPLPARLENKGYDADHPLNAPEERGYRWRSLQTVIDLRNL
jgi:prepilin-type N-terminal cleavage/methylation domain-containing protein